MIRKILFAVLVAALFGACNEVDDTEKPVITIESPSENDVVTTGAGLRLVATVSDDTGLLQYKLTISGVDELNGIAADSTLHLISVEGIANGVKTIYLDDVINLPDSTFNGHYYATLTCIDVEGNQSIRDTVFFQIENSIDSTDPVFNVAGPANDTLFFGQGFSPSGSVTDSQSLIYSSIYIGRTDGSQAIHSFQFPNIANNAVNYDGMGWYFSVDSTWSKGNYHIYYTAWDNYTGVTHQIPFYVTY